MAASLPIPRNISSTSGSSYCVSNALIIFARIPLGLRAPARIQFSPSGSASRSLSKFWQNYSNASVHNLQLRKELKAPFFHEYIALTFWDRKYAIRIDRRQLPNEESPMDCTEDFGVEAYDTIEEILNLEHSMYSESQCLVQIDFEEGIQSGLIIDICRVISQHEKAGVYTVQRYNCYFYAQTILLCILCKEYEWYENYIWGLGYVAGSNDDEEILTDKMPLDSLARESRMRICVLEKKLQLHLESPSDLSHSATELPSLGERVSLWRSQIRFLRSQRGPSQSNIMKETSIGDLQRYLSDMIKEHSLRVGQYQVLLKASARETERDIKQTMNKIWGKEWLLLGEGDST